MTNMSKTDQALSTLIDSINNNAGTVAKQILNQAAEGYFINGIVMYTIGGLFLLVGLGILGKMYLLSKQTNDNEILGIGIFIFVMAFLISTIIFAYNAQNLFAPETIVATELINRSMNM